MTAFRLVLALACALALCSSALPSDNAIENSVDESSMWAETSSPGMTVMPVGSQCKTSDITAWCDHHPEDCLRAAMSAQKNAASEKVEKAAESAAKAATSAAAAESHEKAAARHAAPKFTTTPCSAEPVIDNPCADEAISVGHTAHHGLSITPSCSSSSATTAYGLVTGWLDADQNDQPRWDRFGDASWAPLNERCNNNGCNDQWWQVDLGEEKTVGGIVVQGPHQAGNPPQGFYAKSFEVKTSLDNVQWSDVTSPDGGFEYQREQTREALDEKHQFHFAAQIKARYVRIYPTSCKGQPKMRSAVLVCP